MERWRSQNKIEDPNFLEMLKAKEQIPLHFMLSFHPSDLSLHLSPASNTLVYKATLSQNHQSKIDAFTPSNSNCSFRWNLSHLLNHEVRIIYRSIFNQSGQRSRSVQRSWIDAWADLELSNCHHQTLNHPGNDAISMTPQGQMQGKMRNMWKEQF